MPAMLSALVVQGPLALSAFLVGLATGRVGVLAEVTRHDKMLRRLQWVGYPVGLAGGVVFASGGGTKDLTGLLVSILTAPLLAGAYAATLLRFFHTRSGGRVAVALAPAGRMSLSNYLGQSLLCVLVFTGAGFGSQAPSGRCPYWSSRQEFSPRKFSTAPPGWPDSVTVQRNGS